MIDKKQLCKFLVKAKNFTYAAGEVAEKIKEEDKSITLIFKDGDLIYKNDYTGEVDDFFGEETISQAGKEIYRAKYIGGFVDVRK